MALNNTNYFKESEYSCQCGCGADHLDPRLLDILNKVRFAIGKPIVINSGVRCPAHNKAERGVPGSSHTKGLAVDIKIPTSEYRYYLVKALLNLGIVRIIHYKTFVHIDIDGTKPWPVMMWKE